MLKNFFSYIRAIGGGDDEPSELQFRYRLRWYVLRKYSDDMFMDSVNTEDDGDKTLVDLVDFQHNEQTTDAVMDELLGSFNVAEQED